MVYVVIMDIEPGYPNRGNRGSIRLVNMGEIKQPDNYHGEDLQHLQDYTYWSSLQDAKNNFDQLRAQSELWGPGVEYIDET